MFASLLEGLYAITEILHVLLYDRYVVFCIRINQGNPLLLIRLELAFSSLRDESQGNGDSNNQLPQLVVTLLLSVTVDMMHCLIMHSALRFCLLHLAAACWAGPRSRV